jgi:hypothetical protein
MLVPWDVNMATAMASIERVQAYTDFERTPYKAMAGAIGRLGIKAGYKDRPAFGDTLSHVHKLCRSLPGPRL